MSPAVADDIAILCELGFQQVRLIVPWRLLQPRPGVVDGDIVERYRATIDGARGRGLQVWLQLLEPQVPTWFDDEGGFTDERTAGRWWPRYVETCADRFGDVVDGWVPFEAPYAMARRLVPHDARRHGELMDTLVVAWRDAWRLLVGGPPIAASIDVRVIRPNDESTSAPGADPRAAADEARREDDLRWRLWLRGWANGTISIPGRADRYLPDLAGSVDVVGLALRSDPETCLYRAADLLPDTPLALTVRPTGSDDRARVSAIESMWRDIDRSAGELTVGSVTITPFADTADGAVTEGIVTRLREVKDSAVAFAARP